MDITYKRDLKNNYMIITVEDTYPIDNYSSKIMEYQNIEGVLSIEQRRLDNKLLLYYDITAKQSLQTVLEKSVLSYDKLKKLLIKLLLAIEKTYDHLLAVDDFLLAPEYIYIELTSFIPSLCYFYGYHMNIKEQMSTLLEYLLNKVDYNDKEAVYLIYQLYAISREEGYSFDHLLKMMNHQEVVKQIDNDEQTDSINKDYVSNGVQKVVCKQQNEKENYPKTRENGNSDNFSMGNQEYKNTHNEVDQKKEKSKKSLHIPTLQELNNKKLLVKVKNERKVGVNLHIQQKETTSEKLYNKYDKVPIMLEKLEDEEEKVYYPLKTYLYTALCAALGIFLLYVGITSKLIYNTFGNRIDYSKLFALCLVLLCMEGYVMKKIWDSKNKLTKMIQRKEYIDPRQEFSLFSKKAIVKQERVDRLDYEPDNLHHRKESSDRDQNINNIKGSLTDMNSNKPKPISRVAPNKSIGEEDMENNPTCLLNEEKEIKSFTIILRPVDEINYKTIVITDFPFFIGKLKKNVDYCLENDAVSRFHAKISLEKERYYITDLNSKNGTFVNHEVLQTYQKREITIGDVIAFANIKYMIVKYE